MMKKETKVINNLDDLNAGILWFIKLRWLAIISVLLTIVIVIKIFYISLYLNGILSVCFFIGFYNLIFDIILKIKKRIILKDEKFFYNTIANLQIAIDLFALTVILHFSGGIENPFIFYYIFHIIISSIILSRLAAFLQTTFATLLFLLMVFLEYFGYIPHYSINYIPIDLYNNFLFVVGCSFALISSLYISVYMATNVSNKLRQREEQLEKTNLLLEEKDKIKSEYVLRVSHDIKEHLAAIQGCIEPVHSQITGALNKKQLDLLSRAIERTNKLLFFVKALLEITRLRLNDKIKMECFPIKEAINEAVISIQEKAAIKNISINVTTDYNLSNIIGAKMEIQETIANLLMNSIKYTPENGKIEIICKEEEKSILISIIDNGIGIPQNEMPYIFNEFFRASNAKKIERTGTGLGLTIAKEVIEKHKGKIWIESEENKGTKVFIILPKFQLQLFDTTIKQSKSPSE